MIIPNKITFAILVSESPKFDTSPLYSQDTGQLVGIIITIMESVSYKYIH